MTALQEKPAAASEAKSAAPVRVARPAAKAKDNTGMALILTGLVGAAAVALMLTPLAYLTLMPAPAHGGNTPAAVAAGAGGAKVAVVAAKAAIAGPKGDPANGKDLFAESCAACHGPDALGKPNLGKDLVHSKFAGGLSDPELIAFIKKGRDTTDPLNTTHVAMPPKGGNPALQDAQLKDIVAFIRKAERQG